MKLQARKTQREPIPGELERTATVVVDAALTLCCLFRLV